MTQEGEPRVKLWNERLDDITRLAEGELHSKNGVQVMLARATSDSEITWSITVLNSFGQEVEYELREGFGLESVAVSPNVIVSAPGIDDVYFGRKRQVKVQWSDFKGDEQTSFREQADKVVTYIEDTLLQTESN